MNNIGDELIAELKKINKDRSFVLGVLANSVTEENWLILYKAIKEEFVKTEKEVIMLSLDLGELVDGK